jgi:hypothetical protein
VIIGRRRSFIPSVAVPTEREAHWDGCGLTRNGKILGLAEAGGSLNCPNFSNGCGVAFELSRAPSGRRHNPFLEVAMTRGLSLNSSPAPPVTRKLCCIASKGCKSDLHTRI